MKAKFKKYTMPIKSKAKWIHRAIIQHAHNEPIPSLSKLKATAHTIRAILQNKRSTFKPRNFIVIASIPIQHAIGCEDPINAELALVLSNSNTFDIIIHTPKK